MYKRQDLHTDGVAGQRCAPVHPVRRRVEGALTAGTVLSLSMERDDMTRLSHCLNSAAPAWRREDRGDLDGSFYVSLFKRVCSSRFCRRCFVVVVIVEFFFFFFLLLLLLGLFSFVVFV